MLEKSLHERYCQARRRAIAGEFARLNPPQREGVLATEGPLLLLAGAGSGKTTVLISRIANLLRFGKGSDSPEVPDFVTEDDLRFLEGYQGRDGSSPQEVLRMEKLCILAPCRPWEVLAITFTNKAAGELKDRLERTVGPSALDVWAATFHSACVRILRREIGVLGFPSSFTIYDTDDSIRVVKACLREQNIDEKSFPPRMILNYISQAKDECLLAEDYAKRAEAMGDFRLQKVAGLYTAYQDKLWRAGALDFDDIILHTVRILQQYPEVRRTYQEKFRYVLVDEYQDTNHLQYLLATLLAGGHKNFCVVGDDDQSIYRFRGATIENILSFESEYKEARVIRLEQNYRSTGHILEAANEVIRNNEGRKGKNLWTEAGRGEKVQVFQAVNEMGEAQHIAGQILTAYAQGTPFRDFAVLYRLNALSNQLEMALKRNSIPYRVVGGFRFFERAEIKDMLAYLWVVENPQDDLRLARIINTPPRGIGAKTMETAQGIARDEGCALWTVLARADQYPGLKSAANKLRDFLSLMLHMMSIREDVTLPEFYDEVVRLSGYKRMLEEKKEENATRLENIQELKSSIVGYLENDPEPSLQGFLDEVALYTDLDAMEDKDNCVTLMTMHAAKGLEFPRVFVAGLEEGIFPGTQSIGDPESIEEERRLCYVAMTRAKEVLELTCAGQRMLFGHTNAYRPSRFLREIPPDYVEEHSEYRSSGASLDPWETSWEKPNASQGSILGSGGSRGTHKLGGVTEKSYGSRQAGTKPAAAPARPAPRPAARSAALPAFAKGDMVRHAAFGQGMLLSIQPMGGDALLEIAFDNVGTKRLMLKAAAQHMEKL